jgi:hypothetical protein
MCTIGKKSKRKTFTGYKVVVTDHLGNHYSPYTGIMYCKGEVPILENIGQNAVKFLTGRRLLAEMKPFNQDHFNLCLTAVYMSEKDARNEADDIMTRDEIPPNLKRNFLEMTLSGDLYKGDFEGTPVILGNYIDSIKLIKD